MESTVFGTFSARVNSAMPIRGAVLILLALVSVTPALAQAPAAGSWRDEIQRIRQAPLLLGARRSAKSGAKLTKGGIKVRLVQRRAATTFAAILGESEPNDSVRTADSIALGDQASGVVDPVGDVDTWFVDLTAGQFFSVDVDAAEAGSPLDPELALIAPDGRTEVAFNDDFDGLDSRISYRVPTSGRYYVVIRAFGPAGGPTLRYAINFGTVTCGVVGTELEPNDTPGSATPLLNNDTGAGELCAHDQNPAGDVDFWAFTAQAGTTIELDVDAAQLGLFSDPFLALFASDGITRLAFNDDADGADPRLQYSITTTGTYYAAVSTIADPGGNPFAYELHARLVAPGPGDPISVRAQNLGIPLGLAVGRTGDLLVGDVTGNRVVRVSSQGVVTTFAAGIPGPVGLAFDAFDHLLVVSSDGAVYRVTPEGQSTRFITDAGFPLWVAVASDGRIWLTDQSDRSLRRYSPTGQFEASFDAIAVGGFGPGPLAIGPSDEPYFSNGTEIWRLVTGQLQRVLRDGVVIFAFAFDVAGNIYAPTPSTGRIKLFDPTGAILADPFAVGPDAPQVVAFGRDGTGTTVARLFATDPRVGQLIEMNPAGVAHPGLPVGFRPLPLTPDAAAVSLLLGGTLSAADMRFLDELGNRNGRYDVGDLQAYLRTVGALGAAAAPQGSGNDR